MTNRRSALVAGLALFSFGMFSLNGSSMIKVEASDSNHLTAQNSGNISQDSVIPIEGCGSGCHYE